MASAWTLVDALERRRAPRSRELLAAIEREAGDEALTEDARDRFERADDAAPPASARRQGTLTGYAVVADGDDLTVEAALGSLGNDLIRVLESLGRPLTLLVREDADRLEASLRERAGWTPGSCAAPAPPGAARRPARRRPTLLVRGFEPGATTRPGWRRTTPRSPGTPPSPT